MTTFTFGPFVLETLPPRLTRDHHEIRLRPLVFELLRVLLEHRDECVTYDMLMAEVWKGTHVTRHTVSVTIADLRRHLGEFGHWIVHRSKVGYALQVPGSDPLVRQGWHLWNQRTRSGCTHAVECFTRAIHECPTDFRAYQGLSAAYLSLAIFGTKPPLETYPLFLEAHEHAVRLGGNRPELRCDRGFGLCVFERRFDEAEAELLRARDELPAHVATYVRLGLLYGSRGSFANAAKVLHLGRQADPLSPTLAATEVLVHFWQGNFEEAISVGRRSLRLHPYLHVVRVNFAKALEFSGRLDEARAQYQAAAAIAPDIPWLRALEGACHARMGQIDQARAILEGLQAVRRSEYVDAYFMAILHAALGQSGEALAELKRAVAENSASVYTWDVDPRLELLKNEVRVRRLPRPRAS